MNGQVYKHRVLDIWIILHHLSCFFFFPNTLLYMSGHHSVDIAIWIRQANKTARWRLSEAEQGWGIPRSGWSCKECKDGFWSMRKCLMLPHSFSVLFLSFQELLYPRLPAQFYIRISVDIFYVCEAVLFQDSFGKQRPEFKSKTNHSLTVSSWTCSINSLSPSLLLLLLLLGRFSRVRLCAAP